VQQCNKSAPAVDKGLLNLVKRSPPASPLAVDMLVNILQFDPSRRLTIEDALEHSYVSDFNGSEDAEVAAAKSIPQMDWTFDTALCFDRQTGQPKRFEAQEFRQAFVEARDRLEA